MKLEETETIKYLFDHIKSVWTLSAGALAFVVGILGFISKEPSSPNWIFRGGQFAIALCLIPYLVSVIKGLESHRKLIEAVRTSELLNNDTALANAESEDQLQKERDAQQERLKLSIEEVSDQLSFSRNAFVWGGKLLVVCTLMYIGLSACLSQSKSTDIDITLKNVSVVTPDSRIIEVENTSLTAVDVSSASNEKKQFEIRNLVLKGQVTKPKP
jgi:hypothetical protein